VSLENLGIKVLKFTNEQVRSKIEVILEKISDCIKKQSLKLSSPFRGTGGKKKYPLFP
jgi:very-short-patch-repair endonuclease